MKYFIDTEFKEYHKQPKLFGIKVGRQIPTIDLISIAIVSEDGRVYQALNKDCDLKEVWRVDWLRQNVLLPIYTDHVHGDMRNHVSFSRSAIKGILNEFGKSTKQISEEIKEFINKPATDHWFDAFYPEKPEFYGYYADYDWVVFCQLFGRMLDLPKGFPMYCRDLKQMMDEKGLSKEWKRVNCPDPENEHNALSDAKWNFELYTKIMEVK